MDRVSGGPRDIFFGDAQDRVHAEIFVEHRPADRGAEGDDLDVSTLARARRGEECELVEGFTDDLARRERHPQAIPA